MDEQTFKQQLGEKLIRLRERRGMGLEAAARESGLDVDRLGQYESCRALPALGELMNLAKTYDVSLNFFFLSDPPGARVEVVRSRERWKVKPQTDTAAALNYSYEALSYRLTDKVMSPFFIEIPPDEGKAVEALSHEGEEFHYVLSGDVIFTIEDESHQLRTGDAIYFDSRLPHTIRAVGFTPVRLLACMVNVHRPAEDDDPIQRAY